MYDNKFNSEDSKKNQRKHKRIKIALKIVGPIMILTGIALSIVGFINFGNFETNLFSCAMVGLPLIGFGAMITILGFHKEMQSYAIEETKDNSVHMTNYMLKRTREELSQTLKQIKPEESTDIICPFCKARVDKDSKFCKSCGRALVKVCKYCGCENAPDSKFCKDCGKKLS